MKYSSYNINIASPYFLLHKEDKTPNVLTVGKSNSDSINSIETDMKILTAHKVNAISLITKLSQSNGNELIIPDDLLVHQFNYLPKIATIKIGTLTERTINLLNQHIRNVSIPIIVSACELETTTFNSMKETIFNRSRLFVCNFTKAHELLNISEGSRYPEDIFKVAALLSETTSIPNILITDCEGDNNKIIDVLYHCYNQEFSVFKSKTNVKVGAGPIATAIAANLSNRFSLKESVYGALEYVRNTLLVKESGNEFPNFTHAIETPLKNIIQDECFSANDIVTIHKPLKLGPIIDNTYDYLIEHPFVKPYWQSYVNHTFVKKIADGTLPLKNFQFFVEQDYSYLIDYGKVHCMAASKAPNLDAMEKELFIVNRIRGGVIQHEKRLRKEFGVSDDKYFRNIRRGPALNNYSRYFNDIANRGNFQELTMALLPCLFGYGVAVKNNQNNIKVPKAEIYDEWINTFTNEIFINDMEAGVSLLNDIVTTYPAKDIEKLFKIFGEVCDLETKFWDAALEYK